MVRFASAAVSFFSDSLRVGLDTCGAVWFSIPAFLVQGLKVQVAWRTAMACDLGVLGAHYVRIVSHLACFCRV